MESWEVEVGLVQGLGVMYMLTEPDFGGGVQNDEPSVH